MKQTEKQQEIPEITSWEERLKQRQDALTGRPADSCLMGSIPVEWVHVHCRADKITVAATCLRVHPECDACRNFINRFG